MKLHPLVVLALLLALTSVALSADDPGSLYEAGRAAEATRDFRAAAAAYEKVLDLDEDYEDAFERWDYCVALIEWQDGLAGEPTAADLVALAERWLELGRYADEKKCYEDAIEADPKYRDGHGHLALWNYTRGGGFPNVYRETLTFLGLSPWRAELAESVANFEIYGALRNLREILGETGTEVEKLSADEKWGEAADRLEAIAATDLPEGARQWAWFQCGSLRRKSGNEEAARAAFGRVLEGTPSSLGLSAHLALAELDAAADALEPALDHLRAAVAEGSGACRRIEQGRAGAYRPLFEAADPAIREAVAALTDEKAADEPIRARIRAACEKAGTEGKRVLLHWYGPYCPFVMAMQERLAHPEVRALIAKHYVYVRMDQGSMHRGLSVDEEYGDVMRRHGVPCFFILDPDGSVKAGQKDLGLAEAPHRSYSVPRIVDWLTKNAPKAGTPRQE